MNMPVIVYAENGSECQIDELCQQILVYLGFYGESKPSQIREKIGGESEEEIISCVETYLDDSAAGFVTERESQQQTLTGDINRYHYYALTDSGSQFIYEHKNIPSAPTSLETVATDFQSYRNDLEELRSRADDLIGHYHDKMESIEESHEEILERLSTLEQRVEELESDSGE